MQAQHSPDRTKGKEEEVAGSTRACLGGHEESESLAGMIVPRGETVFVSFCTARLTFYHFTQYTSAIA